MKTRLLILLLLPLSLGAQIISEDFEGTGIEPGWTETGTPDWDYSADVLEQSQSLSIAAGGNEYVEFTITPGSTFHAYAIVRMTDYPVSLKNIMGLRTAADQATSLIQINETGQVGFYYGGNAVTSDSFKRGASIHIWLTYNQGGTCSVAWSLDGLKPTSGSSYASATDFAPSSPTRFRIGHPNGAAFVIDSVILSTSNIGDNPTQATGDGSTFASDGSAVNVQARVNEAGPTDIVTIPPGTFSWTNTVNISKNISLRGTSRLLTKIIDDMPDDNADTITDEPMLRLGVHTGVLEVSAIWFEFGLAETSTRLNGVITATGFYTGGQILFHGCIINEMAGVALFANDLYGVFSGNIIARRSSIIPLFCYNANYGGNQYGHGSMSGPSNFGSDEFFFVEDNQFVDTYGQSAQDTSHYAIIDAYRGARYVFRGNTINSGWIEAHGTDSSGVYRGTRAVEIYDNTFIGTDGGNIIANFRSGVGVVYDNTVTGGYMGAPRIQMDIYRTFYQWSPYQGATGNNSWDDNAPGNPIDSGTATGGSTLVLEDSGAGWTPNQWDGYILNVPAKGHAEIRSNTSTSLTIRNQGSFGPDLVFASGDVYEINQVIETIDQPGKSGGTELSGASPTVPPGWYDQDDEPHYEWNNLGVSSYNIGFSIQSDLLRESEHWIEDTVKPGYTAYTYPHPIRSQVPPPPAQVAVPVIDGKVLFSLP